MFSYGSGFAATAYTLSVNTQVFAALHFNCVMKCSSA
jgi:3-hydroxy-3-methylglutaryl CoA synthase